MALMCSFADGLTFDKPSTSIITTMTTTDSRIERVQLAVGNCPVCGKLPDWFNNVPLTAYCWGQVGVEHQEARRVVPSPFQPYGKVKSTRWVVSS